VAADMYCIYLLTVRRGFQACLEVALGQLEVYQLRVSSLKQKKSSVVIFAK
jgi:hypothetical protein